MSASANRITIRLSSGLDERLRALGAERHLNVSQMSRIALEIGLASIEKGDVEVVVNRAIRREVATELYASLEEHMRRTMKDTIDG